MYRVITSSNRALAQRAIRSTLTFTRSASNTDPEAGSVAGQDAFGKREKAEETRWARRFEAEQAQKYQNRQQTAQGGTQPIGNAQAYGQQQSANQGSAGAVDAQIAALEAEKKRIKQQIAELKRQQR